MDSDSKIETLSIEEEMKGSYLSYAMSVIIQRALPDVRDGLKPSQRRILVAMHEEDGGTTQVDCLGDFPHRARIGGQGRLCLEGER